MFFSGWLRKSHARTARKTPARSAVRLQCEMLEDRVVPTLMGNQVFPLDNPWNQKIANAPVAANSATLVSSVGLTRGLKADFGSGQWEGAIIGIPYNVVSGTQPKVNVVIDAYADESDIVPVPIPSNPVIEGDPSNTTSGDRHLLVHDKDNNLLYELYNVSRPSQNSDGRWHADSQAVWDLNENSFREPGWTSADAAGLPILPGLVRPDEVFDRGVIDHAIRFTVPRSANQYIFPASHQAGSANSAYPRMGERFRLKQSFDISGFSPANQVILQAMKDYGLIVSDNGSAWYVSGEPSSRWNNTDLHRLGSVLGSNFEVVDLTPIVSGLSSSTGGAGSTIIISGLNFSGGAGMTQVFFGSTQATQFTITSDSSISVVAPAGTTGSAVNVTVRSPYGDSAASSSARFTYGTATPQPGRFQFSASTYSVNEGAGSLTITVTRTNGSNGAVSVDYAVAGVSAAPDDDYVPVSGTLNFADGQTSRTFTISIINDTIVESSESFALTLSSPTGGATLGSPATATVTIADNDVALPAGRFQFNASAYKVSEATSSLTITVTRTNGSSGAVSVDYSLIGISASPAEDYVPVSGTLNFASGQTSQRFSIPILNDLLVEGAETFGLLLSNPTGGATLGAPTTATVTIADNDRPGVLQFSASSYKISEGGGSLEVTVIRTNGNGGNVTLDYTATGISASAGLDFTAVSGTLHFAPGQLSQTFAIPIVDDILVEPTENLRLTLSNPTGGATLGTRKTAVAYITNNDVPIPGVFELGAPVYTVSEKGGFIQIEVIRNVSSNSIATVQYTTQNITARSGYDYIGTAGTLKFAPGETSKTILIPILNDNIVEGDETFRVLLRSPRTATLGAVSSATVTITDDDSQTETGVAANTAVHVTLDESHRAAANWAWFDYLLRTRLRHFVVTWDVAAGV